MNKMMKTWIAALVVLALGLVPMAAMAEGRATTFTVGNTTYRVGEEEGAIGASFTVRSAEDGDKALVELSAEGMTPISRMLIGVDGDTYKGWIDGLSSAYTITGEQIEEIMKSAMEQEGAPDTAAMQKMFTAYFNMLEEVSSMEVTEEQALAMQEKMMASSESLEEGQTFEAMGKSHTGQKATFKMGKFMQASIDSMREILPSYAEFMDAYFEMLSEVGNMDKMTMDQFVEQVYGGQDSTIAMWMTEPGDAVRMEMKGRMASEENTHTADMDMVMEAEEANGVTNMTGKMSVSSEGSLVTMNFDGSGLKDEAGEDFTMGCTMDIADAGKTVGQMTMNMSVVTRGGVETFAMDMGVIDEGKQVASVKLGYDGTVTGEGEFTEHKGKVAFGVKGIANTRQTTVEIVDGEPVERIVEAEDQTIDVSFGFDVTMKTEPLTGEIMAELDSLPALDATTLDEEALAQLMEEIQVVGIGAMGAVLQTPGVAELISKATTFAMQEYATNQDVNYPVDEGYTYPQTAERSI